MSHVARLLSLSLAFVVLSPVWVMTEPVSWTGSWLAPDLPLAADPPWAFLNGETVTQTDFLNINSSLEETSTCYVQNAGSGHWTVTEAGVTVLAEFRVNTMEGFNAGAVILSGFGPGRKQSYVLYLGDGWVQLGNQESGKIPTDSGQFVTVRITANDAEASVYLNESKEAAITLPLPEDSESDHQRLTFGDPSSFGGGDVDWKTIKWSAQGAYAP